MRASYPYLCSGLDSLSYDPVKRGASLRDAFRFAMEEFSPRDRDLLRKLFLFNDIKNVVLLHFRRKERQEDYQTPAYYLESDYESVKADPMLALPFLRAWWENKAAGIRLFPQLPETDELTTLFYERLDSLLEDGFLKDWYLFELELRNFTVALTLEATGLDPEGRLIPYGVVFADIEAGKRASRDAGAALGYLESVRAGLEDLSGAERERERVRWAWIDERLGPDWSSADAVLGSLIKLWAVERWENLTRRRGEERFESILDTMRRSIRFAVEFGGA